MNTNKLNIKKSIALAFAVALLPATPAFAEDGEGTLNLIPRTPAIAVGDLAFGDIVRPVSGSAGSLTMTCPSGAASVALAGGVENPDTNDDECGVVTITATGVNQSISVTFASSTAFTNDNDSSTLGTKFTLYDASGVAVFDDVTAGSASASRTRTFANTTPVNWHMGTEVSGISSTDTLGNYTATYELTVEAN